MAEQTIQQKILDAAELRFQSYGYGKTTMAEIAADCEMSAANLYRYFENKQAIGAGLAQQCLLEKELLLKQVVEDKEKSAAEKLAAFIQQLLDHTYSHFESKPRLAELVEAITTQRPDVVEAHRSSKLNLLTQLLEQGRETGEFVFDDIKQTADAIHTASLLFYFPICMAMYSYQDLVKKAQNVTQLLLNGINAN